LLLTLAPGVALALVVLTAVALTPRSASAQTASSQSLVLYGFITPGDAGIPSRVRALVGDVVCGTAETIRSEGARGFYILSVAPGQQKSGCATHGAVVQLQLLTGEVDPGVLAAEVVFVPGEALRVDLAAEVNVLYGAFIGSLPTGPGHVILRWDGASAVPIASAIASIPREVIAVHYWDAQRQVFRSYITGAPAIAQSYTFVDAGDIVIAHVK
jgi:hypothetical protein